MAPDGYSLVVSSVGSHGIVPAVVANPGYDAMRDFTHIGMLGVFHSVLVVHPAFPARDLAGFIAEAKRRPGALNYATSGIGSSNHLMGEVMKGGGICLPENWGIDVGRWWAQSAVRCRRMHAAGRRAAMDCRVEPEWRRMRRRAARWCRS